MSSSPSRESVPLSKVVADYELYSAAFLKIVDMDQNLVPFVWNRPQHRLADAVHWQESRGMPVRVIILKSRKVGISTWVQGFNFWRNHLREHHHAVTLAHVIDSAEQLFEIQRQFYDSFALLPDDHPLHVKRRRLTRKLISFGNTRSTTQVLTVGKGTGRGMTPSELHASEIAFWANAKDALTAVRNGVPKRPGTAVFVESTPHGWGSEFHEMWLRAKAKKSGYIALFISWLDDPRSLTVVPWFDESELDDEERELVKLRGATLPQLAWRRSIIEDECGGDPEVFRQEYPSDDISCWLASGRPAFTPEEITYQTEAMPQPDPYQGLVQSEIRLSPERGEPEVVPERRGRLIVLREPIARHRYIAAWDPSEGDPGSCASPGVVLDQVDLKVSAVWYGRTPPDVLAEHAVLLARWYNESLLMWEANNHGIAFGNEVDRLGYSNIFTRPVSEESTAQKPGTKPGYSTRERSRQHLFNCVRAYARLSVKNGWPPIMHPLIVGEMSTLIYEEDKAVAQPGKSIDLLICLGMVLFAHRGTMDSPLEPLAKEVIQRAFLNLIPKLRLGIRPSQQELDEGNLTMEELERLDQMEYELARAKSRKGLGRSN